MPSTHEEWNTTINGFNEKWNFPSCCGAIDGKHVLIEAPPNSGSQFFNYKGSHSVVLLAAVDHNYCFPTLRLVIRGQNLTVAFSKPPIFGFLWKTDYFQMDATLLEMMRFL